MDCDLYWNCSLLAGAFSWGFDAKRGDQGAGSAFSGEEMLVAAGGGLGLLVVVAA